MSMSTKRSIAIVSACMQTDGRPTFARTQVNVTPEEAENGVHYFLAEAELLRAGFEEPYVHFPEDEAPAFLFPAAREFLDSSEVLVPTCVHSEDP